MSFSLRWLFAVVAIAALFASAFTVQNYWWASGMVALTVAVLLAGVVGLSLGLLNKPFWLPFCIVGWAYLLLSLTAASITRLPAALPTTRAAFEVWTASREVPTSMGFLRDRPELSRYSVYLANEPMLSTHGEQFYEFLNIVHCLFTLVLATIAGVIASYCVRRSKIAEH